MITVKDILNLFEEAGIDIIYRGIKENDIEKFSSEELGGVPSNINSWKEFGYGTSVSLKLSFSSFPDFSARKLIVEKRGIEDYFLNSKQHKEHRRQ